MRYMTLILSTALILGLTLSVVAKDKDSEEAVIKSSLSKDGNSTACLGACKVNFRQELKVPFNYLDALGSQIHEARKLPDPVALAAAAKSLSVAEAVAGKKAKITSDAIMEEAVQLAKLRGNASELKAISMLVSDKRTSNDLSQMAAAAAKNKPEEGEASKELNGDLRVENHTGHTLAIFMDGKRLGWVHPGRTYTFHVHNHKWHNHFDAYCADDGELIRHADYEGHAHFLRWHIDD